VLAAELARTQCELEARHRIALPRSGGLGDLQ
jgi:hypothetical protein